MRMRILLILVALLSGYPASTMEAQQLEDVVYLHDGSVIRGTIVEQIPNQSLLIRTRDGSTFRITMDRIQRITKEPQYGAARAVPDAPYRVQKSPGSALALSFLLTGGGQFYNEQAGKGLLQLSLGVLSAGVFLVGIDDCYAWEDYDCTIYGVGLAGLLATKVWSMADAWMSANRINQELALGVRIDPAVEVRHGRLGLRLLALPI